MLIWNQNLAPFLKWQKVHLFPIQIANLEKMSLKQRLVKIYKNDHFRFIFLKAVLWHYCQIVCISCLVEFSF